jgi:hypothetical protein
VVREGLRVAARGPSVLWRRGPSAQARPPGRRPQLDGSFSHSFAGGTTGTTTNTWGGGLFGELGAGWLVTPHLALGAAWRLSADYEHSSWTTGAFSGSSDGFFLTLGGVRLTGQLYF